MEEENTSSLPALLNIHPDALVISEAVLKGRITIGPGTVIHPKAVVNAGIGQIIMGSNNIVEETATIQNMGDADYVLVIGDDNLFEIGSVCHAPEIGSNNIFGIQSTVGPNVTITDGCRIGAKCTLLIEEKIPPQTVICFSQNLRKTATEKPTGQKSQADFLKKLMPKYSMAIKNTMK